MKDTNSNVDKVLHQIGRVISDSTGISEATGLTVNEVKNCLERLRSRGDIRRVPGGYVLAKKDFNNYWLTRPWRANA